MKKMAIILGSIGLLLAGVVFFFYFPYAENQLVGAVFNYPQISLDTVYDNRWYNDEQWYIEDNKTPKDYGFEYEDFETTSLIDKDIKLKGWWVPSAKDSNATTVMLLHGRTANRLKPMKYLQLYKDLGLDSTYNFIIPDLRNSGESSASQSQMGNKFGEDIVAIMQFAHQKSGGNKFISHAFSMGALGTAVAIGRTDLQEVLAKDNLVFDKLILDSPLSNVQETFIERTKSYYLPAFVYNNAFSKIEEGIDAPQDKPFFDKMRLGYLLKDFKNPALIMSNEGDKATPLVVLKKEMEDLTGDNFQAAYFEKNVDSWVHVRMYIQHKERYEQLVGDFLK